MRIIETQEQNNTLMAALKIESQEFDKALRDAYMDHTDEYLVPGYAPGLAPREEIEKLYGEEALWNEALDLCIPVFYRNFLQSEKIRTLGRPEVTEIARTMDGGFMFSVQAERYPKVELGDYKGLAVTADKKDGEAFRMAVLKAACDNMTGEVSDAMVEAKLDALAAREKLTVGQDSVYHLLGDTAAVLSKAYKATGVTRPMAQVQSEAMDIMLETVSGNNADPSQDFLAGQIAHLVAQYRPLPADFGDVMDRLFAERAQEKAGMTPEEAASEAFDAYLGSINLNESAWRRERREEAAESARCDLLLDAVADREGLALTDDEITGMILKIADASGVTPEEVRDAIDLEALKGQMLRDKACDLLLDAAVVV